MAGGAGDRTNLRFLATAVLFDPRTGTFCPADGTCYQGTLDILRGTKSGD